MLIALSIAGMLIVQQNVDGFDTYYASLTPAEKVVYGAFGLFDIYHSWYFNLLLLVLSLNIVLASIDHFPAAWKYLAAPKLVATPEWLRKQRQTAELKISADDEVGVVNKVIKAFSENGLKVRVNEFNSVSYAGDETGQKDFTRLSNHRRLLIFGENGGLNRLGAYIVHIALLTLFIGHFVALQTGLDATVRMVPGETTDQIQTPVITLDSKEEYNVQIPFTISCIDIQQKLIDPQGSIDVTNTLDWRTQIRINDPEYGETSADISMNKPFSYRGYRFFQAQTIPVGNARSITLDVTPQDGGETVNLDVQRLGEARLADGTIVEYDEFLPDFTFGADGKPGTRSGDYNNPAAVLGVTSPGGQRTRVFAFARNTAENIPIGAPKAGYKWRLAGYEKVPVAHVLSIKYDPYGGSFIAWYFGGFGLLGALGFVFFFSHKRVWALIEEGRNGSYAMVLAGDSNRNYLALEEKFKKILESVGASADVTAELN